MLHIPAPDILQFVINRPFAQRPLVLLFHYVDEACFLNPFLEEWRYHEILPKLPACFQGNLIATIRYIAWSDGAVV